MCGHGRIRGRASGVGEVPSCFDPVRTTRGVAKSWRET
jgi:hypothetical protein